MTGRSPRAWGWTGSRGCRPLAHDEIPTRVGMDRARLAERGHRIRDPHARGDGPQYRQCFHEDNQRSPRAWGWTAGADARAGD